MRAKKEFIITHLPFAVIYFWPSGIFIFFYVSSELKRIACDFFSDEIGNIPQAVRYFIGKEYHQMKILPVVVFLLPQLVK